MVGKLLFMIARRSSCCFVSGFSFLLSSIPPRPADTPESRLGALGTTKDAVQLVPKKEKGTTFFRAVLWCVRRQQRKQNDWINLQLGPWFGFFKVLGLGQCSRPRPFPAPT